MYRSLKKAFASAFGVGDGSGANMGYGDPSSVCAKKHYRRFAGKRSCAHPPVSLRLGLAAALTAHCAVIHYRVAPSAPVG